MDNKQSFKEFTQELIDQQVTSILECVSFADQFSLYEEGYTQKLENMGYTKEDIESAYSWDCVCDDLNNITATCSYLDTASSLFIGNIGEFEIALDYIPKQFRKDMCDYCYYSKENKAFFIPFNAIEIPISRK